MLNRGFKGLQEALLPKQQESLCMLSILAVLDDLAIFLSLSETEWFFTFYGPEFSYHCGNKHQFE